MNTGIGDRIREARERREMRQDQLARAVGVTPQAVSQWEKNKTAPDVKRIIDIADAVEEDPIWIAFNVRFTDQAPTVRRSSNDNMAVLGERDVQAAAGGGRISESEPQVARWGFPVEWLRSELRSSPSDLEIITIEGDSLVKPNGGGILPGTKVIINTKHTKPSPPGVFILWDGVGIVAKRLEVIPNTDPIQVRIISDNPSYETYVRTLDEIQIVARLMGKLERI